MAISTAAAILIGTLVTAGTALATAGGGDSINIPTAQVPAPPAPTRRTDTGAKVVVGSDAVQNQRVSGRGKVTTGARDVLGALGGGSGINI